MNHALQGTNNFKTFYQGFHLTEYPFGVYTAENELDKQAELFVQPTDYDPIVESYQKNQTMIIVGERGTGKTALVLDLLRRKPENNNIIIKIEDFSSLSIGYDSKRLYLFIIRKISEKIFDTLFASPQKIKKITPEQKILLSLLLSKYTSELSKSNLKKKINKIQHSILKKLSIAMYNPIRYVLNYGLSGLTYFVNDAITRHFALPAVQDSHKIKEYFPELSLESDIDFIDQEASYSFLTKVLHLVSSLDFINIILVFDKIDEDPRLDNDANNIAEFIKPLLTDNKLLTSNELQIVVSLWAVAYTSLKPYLRSQKHSCPTIKWTKNDLLRALDRRILVYSNHQISSHREILAPDIQQEDIDRIIELSNGSPRDLWHIMDKLMRAQFDVDQNSNRISHQAIINGINKFISTFNYYENYPRKANSKANTMDIYNYIKHLLKLDNITFTKNRLNELASTGSSTPNYVSQMEGMGLITRDGKESGNATVYRIKDPKIVFAITNKIDIRRD